MTYVAAIRTAGLTKRYGLRGLIPGRPRGYVDALKGLDLCVAKGSIHGLIGPNGSGKSTLMKILATLVLPTAGQAFLADTEVTGAPLMARRQVGYSTGEERSLYWRLTGRQNLEFYGALYHLRDARERIDETLEALDLEAVAERQVWTYSQGMMRRLGLARALLHQPPIVLLDEPTRSLDPIAREDFHQLLHHLHRDHRTTIFIASHDLAEVVDVCDSVSVLRDGALVWETASPDLREMRSALRESTA